jgi:predicted Zn-ribbon and HTH transcriptional regulator
MFRKDLLAILTVQPRSVSSIARELGLKRGDVEDDLRHLIRSARAAGHQVVVEPARCRACGFTFGEDKLAKPGKCPACKSTWLFEAQVRIEAAKSATTEDTDTN